eukprot:scaffold229297_cov17-Tisochrysis_lutea.AAC.1
MDFKRLELSGLKRHAMDRCMDAYNISHGLTGSLVNACLVLRFPALHLVANFLCHAVETWLPNGMEEQQVNVSDRQHPNTCTGETFLCTPTNKDTNLCPGNHGVSAPFRYFLISVP